MMDEIQCQTLYRINSGANSTVHKRAQNQTHYVLRDIKMSTHFIV